MASSSQATTSASSKSNRPSSYDVFFNFRGLDTRDDFVFLLYKALKGAGIYAFQDSEQLWKGEEICSSLLRAIRGSKISIPVFSKHYADSKYCLLELAQIWECHLSNDQIVLPIFIDVEPRDVRHQTGSFHVGPFQEENQSKYESAMIEGWKNALTEVGKLNGWTLKGDATIREQSNIVELVVQKALGELNSIPLDEPQHLIGIDSHMKELHGLLHIGSDDVRFVAICGMGGLGKTTIAKAIYDLIFTSFNGSSFLADVREEASQGNKGLISLQKQLLKDILKHDHVISTVSQGSKLIKERLHREKILLILDDVDDYEQLDALAGGINWFGQGSKIIITTRDEHILNVHEGKVREEIQIYKPELLDFEKSLQLFSLYAFPNKEPPENCRQFSHEVIRYAEGLPLTLEVLGSFLTDKNTEEWKDTLGRLKDILDDKVNGKSIKTYDDKVFGKLMISYNKLDDHEKTIFLDVACHFNGWYKEYAISIWKACELRPGLAIKQLTQKHLLKIDADGRLKMHDQLRYMGMSIILKDSHGDPARRSRLWSQDEIRKALKKNTGTQMVEGIILYRKSELEAEDALKCEDFQNMPNLRFLELLYNGSINGDLRHLPSKLRWFHSQCNWKTFASNFYHPDLIHLHLSCTNLERAWNDPPQNKNERFQKLEVLELHHCGSLSISPDFSWFPCLERLNLNGCGSLLELSASICLMTSLKTLFLRSCYSLKKLPTSIGNLKHLVELNMSSTKIEELPDGVGQLEKLEKLDVSYCKELVKLPTSMGRMKSLHHFDLEDAMIAKLPDDFSKLSSLEVLRMGSLSRYCFEDLDETYCCYMRLDSLSELPSALTHLQVGAYHISLPKIPDLSHLERLEELLLEGCKSLVELDLSNLGRLREVDIFTCENLEEIHGLKGLESLEELNVCDCVKLREIPDLSKLKRLRYVDISTCENLEEIHGLERVESLEKLKVHGCVKLREIPDLSKLKCLRKADISNCENLEEIHGLGGTESLTELYVEGCYKITETRRKIHGQGRLVDNVGEGHGSRSIADDEIYDGGSPILCVVFEFTGPREIFEPVTISFEIEASIRREEMRTMCWHSIRIEDMKWIPNRDIIYIHHLMRGFDWFGFPLESKDAIEVLEIRNGCILSPDNILDFGSRVKVKFWKILFENRESEQQMPDQQSSAMLVADFFEWLDADDEEMDEEERALTDDTTKDLLNCLEEEMVRPNKRARAVDNDDEASDFSLNLTLSQPNINDDVLGFPPRTDQEAGPSIIPSRRGRVEEATLRATATPVPDEDDAT